MGERSPWKDTFPAEDLTTITRITKLCEQWGQVLAAHHARADRDWDASVVPGSIDGEIKAAGQGLKNMRLRAQTIDGGFALRSRPGRGTALEVVLRA